MKNSPSAKMNAINAIQASTVVVLCLIWAIGDADEMPTHYKVACVTCHQQMVSGHEKILYTRKDSLVTDYRSLNTRVRHCRDRLALDWNEAETRTVVQYLAKHFYQYAPPE